MGKEKRNQKQAQQLERGNAREAVRHASFDSGSWLVGFSGLWVNFISIPLSLEETKRNVASIALSTELLHLQVIISYGILKGLCAACIVHRYVTNLHMFSQFRRDGPMYKHQWAVGDTLQVPGF